MLNSDDVFRPGKLERCAALFRERPGLDLVFGGVGIMGPRGEAVTDGPVIEWLDRAHGFADRTGLPLLSLLHENYCVTTSNMVFRRSLFERNGGFQPLRYCHDLDFLAASYRNGTVFDDRGTEHIGYRVHPANTIKEALARIRVEIAAVLTSAIVENGPDLLGGAGDPAGSAALLEVLRAKNVSDLVALLAASYRGFPGRGAFYERASAAPLAALHQGALARGGAGAPAYLRAPVPPRVASPGRSPAAPMAVAIEVSSFDKGGLEKVVLDSAVLFRERGFAPLIVSAGPVGHLGEVAASQGIEVVRLPVTGRHAFYTSLLTVRDVRLSMSHFSRAGYPVFRELGIPNITFIHNVYAFLAGEALANFKADDRYVQSYISVSRNATRYATGRLGLAAAKVLTVANGIILDEHERRSEAAEPVSRAALGLSEGDYVFLNVASYNLHKAHYLMTRAMEILLTRRRDIKIVCVGNEVYPPHVRALRAHIEARGLSEHVLMPGFFPEVAALHRMSDAFLLPSFIEGWSIAMNEAMFHGKPMILSDTGGSAEVIDGEDTGILLPNEYGDTLNLTPALLDELAYEPRDYRTAPALAEAMERFADAPERWRAAGQRGRAKVAERFTFDQAVERYVVEMRRAVEQRPARR